jgi:hypothetical protein
LLHLEPEWRTFHIPTSDDIDDVISATVVLQSRFKKGAEAFLFVISVYVYIIKKKLHGGLKI